MNLTRFERWALGVILYATTCLACAAPRSLVPLVLRPDTRRIMSFQMESTLVRLAVEQFEAALPNERALCLAGDLTALLRSPQFKHVQVTGVRPAAADSADQFHVYLTRSPRSGCLKNHRLIAAAHDHHTVPPDRPCTHSDPDAFVLFEDIRLLFTLVFCPVGRGEVLFQDGRRGEFRWSGPALP